MNICMYGAASDAVDKAYLDAAYRLGQALARRGHGLVFGGGDTGLMGAAARGVSEGGGYLLGVAPAFFQKPGVLYQHCTEFCYTDTMRARKQLMEDRSDAFIMAPGGIGTFEEFFEILTLKQLGRHEKPIAVLNTRGYYAPLLAMLQSAADQGFLAAENLSLCAVHSEPEALLDWLEAAV
ncbi:MAG: TIGR00730 family Rossman fold protein [Oscillospiraceae bacterium]|nr:TIGR00730 family Rossman fold protein [Oscillospiraceae bacterium]